MWKYLVVLAAAGLMAAVWPREAATDLSLDELARRAETSYRERSSLHFRADLKRYWGETENGSPVHYQAEARMEEGVLETQVEELISSSNSRLIADIVIKNDVVVKNQRTAGADECLFGTLTQSWVGRQGQPPPFARWIAAGYLAGKENVDGSTCYKVIHNRVFTQPRYYRSEHILYVSDDTFLVKKWVTNNYLEPGASVWMVRERLYEFSNLKEKETDDEKVADASGPA